MESGSCNNSTSICQDIEKSLVASLKWIEDLSVGFNGTALFDRSPSSSNVSSVAGSGNVTGLETGFRIIEYIGNANPSARTILIQTLAQLLSAKSARLTPIPSYLRSVAFQRY